MTKIKRQVLMVFLTQIVVNKLFLREIYHFFYQF